MKLHYRPGATPLERLEAYLASSLCLKPDVPEKVANLLVHAANAGPRREKAIRGILSSSCIQDRAEALGMARAVLLLGGVVPERRPSLSGKPQEDFKRFVGGEHLHEDLASPEVYAVPSILDAYHSMGAGFGRGVDRVFQAVTGQPLGEHLRRALALLEPVSSREASGGG